MLDKREVKDITEKYAERIKTTFNPKSIILFGSYANGVPHDDSDIDIAVLVDNFQGNWHDAEVMLYTLRHGISFDIEPHLFDETNDPSGFVSHVIKTGETIYQSDKMQ